MTIGYKAFKKELKAFNGFQYEVGQTYETSDALKFSANGFHYCEMPLDLDIFHKPKDMDQLIKIYGNDLALSAYSIEYAEVEILGDVMHDITKHQSITNKIKILRTLSREELLACILDGETITSCGDKFYFKNQTYHNVNPENPAIIRANGDKYWYQNGNLHRGNDLPARILANGDKEWHVNGKIHRDNDLPAISESNGNKLRVWYTDGKEIKRTRLPPRVLANHNLVWRIQGNVYIEEK